MLVPGEGQIIERMSDALLAGVLVPEDRFDAGDLTPDTIIVVDKRTVTPDQDEPGPRRVYVKFSDDITAITVSTAHETYEKTLPASGRLSLTLKAGEVSRGGVRGGRRRLRRGRRGTRCRSTMW